MERKLILASASPRRKELLASAGFAFAIDPAKGEEKDYAQLPPVGRTESLSADKAAEIAEKYPDCVVLGADTLVFLGNESLGKPRNEAHAKEMLQSLSDNTHSVCTSVTVICGAQKKTVSSVAQVTFKPLSEKEIDAYIATLEPMDKAGAYGIQGGAAAFVTRLEGDITAVIGLPVEATKKLLAEFGLTPQ